MVDFIVNHLCLWAGLSIFHGILCFWSMAFTLPVKYDPPVKRQEGARLTLFLLVWLLLSPVVWPISLVVIVLALFGGLRRLLRLAVHGDG